MGFIQYGIPTFHFDNTGKMMGGSDIPTLPSRTPSAKMLVLESVRVLKEISKS